jgi:hypothetical protein
VTVFSYIGLQLAIHRWDLLALVSAAAVTDLAVQIGRARWPSFRRRPR